MLSVVSAHHRFAEAGRSGRGVGCTGSGSRERWGLIGDVNLLLLDAWDGGGSAGTG